MRAALLPTLYTGTVEDAADNVIADAGQIPDPAAAHEDYRVLLQIVPFTAYIYCRLFAIGEADAGDLPQRRVRLLRRHRLHEKADTPLLRIATKEYGLTLFNAPPSAVLY